MRSVIVIAAICLVLSGCKTNSSRHPAKRIVKHQQSGYAAATRIQPAVLQPGAGAYVHRAGSRASPYMLDSGDQLRVTVFGQTNLSRLYLVDGGGFISMPLVGAIEARGASTFQLEERIAQSLKRKYVKDPKVTVEVQTNRPFFILGEVQNGGQFPYVADMTVRKAIAIAGGFTPRAKKNTVHLTRHVRGTTLTRKVPVNWKVRPGDTITVQERFF